MRTVGVEEELLLVDPVSGVPRPKATQVLAQSERDGHGDVEAELQQQQVEIASDKHTSVAALLEDLRERRAEAAAAARSQGVEVAALATASQKGRPTITYEDRYLHMAEDFGLTAREQLTCGCHVHVEVDSDDEGVAVLDRIRPWLAVLLALSTNSPFWQDQDTGFASFRHELWGRWPSAGPTEIFGSAARYRDVVDALVATPALLDRKMVYFDARLSDRYPTVEIRVADVCLQVEDAALMAALCRGLVDTAAAAWRRKEPPDPVRTELLRAGAWTASQSGLDDHLLDPASRRPVPAARAVQALLAHAWDALRTAGDLDFVQSGLAAIAERGTGAQRQRAWRASGLDRAGVVLAAVGVTAGGEESPARHSGGRFR